MAKIRFLIACEARTGSNWLCGLLQSHPRVLCHHEVFHPEDIYYASWGFRDGRMARLGTLAERDADPQAFLERLWRADFGRAAVGFKMLAGQAPRVLDDLLADRSVKKIILRRENRLRVYLSLLRARETGRWSQKSYDGLAVRIETQELAEFVRRYESFYAGLRAATRVQPVREVHYEDLQREPAQLARLLEFLEVGSAEAELQPFNARQSHDSLREAIQNFDELRSELRGTELEAELREDDAAFGASGSAD